jgi:hypothetical protein
MIRSQITWKNAEHLCTGARVHDLFAPAHFADEREGSMLDRGRYGRHDAQRRRLSLVRVAGRF